MTSLLKRHGFLAEHYLFKDAWNRKPHQYPIWVQAEGETDFAFMHRVLARDGIYYVWREEGLLESLLFLDTHLLHPHLSETFTIVSPWDGFQQPALGYIYHFACTLYPKDYTVSVRDVCPQDGVSVIKAQVGCGKIPVMKWGVGALNQKHLEEQATYLYETLMMNRLIYEADSYTPYWQVGHKATFADRKVYLLQKVKHYFHQGSYRNELTFIPAEAQVRLKLTERKAGQLIHKATLYSYDEYPYLDKEGHYTYKLDIHSEQDETGLQKAPRLSPHGGNPIDKAMGMHFPLYPKTEVLVMYLHNDFNQPILQNAIETKPICDNSWQTLIKTAWQQYLSFCDKEETVTLANASERNRLCLKEGKEPGIDLTASQGSLSFKAKKAQHLFSEADIITEVSGNYHLRSEENTEVNAEIIHLQGQTCELKSNETIEINAAKPLSIESRALSLNGEALSVSIEGDVSQWMLENGDLIIEADTLTITAAESMSIGNEKTALKLTQTGIEMYSDDISLKGETLCFNAPVSVSAQRLNFQGPIIKPYPHIFPQGSYYEHCIAKMITPPLWERTEYTLGEEAKIHLSLMGFKENQTGTLKILAWDKDTLRDKDHPLKAKMGSHKEIHTLAFCSKKGNETITLSVTLDKALLTEKGPFYLQATLDGMNNQGYSNAMTVMSNLKIIVTEDRDYQTHQPASVSLQEEALQVETKPYESQALFYNLKDHANYTVTFRTQLGPQEVLKEDYTQPLPQHKVEVTPHETKSVTLRHLMRPMIMDLRDLKCTEDTFKLSEEEIAYIQKNGNNLTLFIHGFNVDFGAFHRHLCDIHVNFKPYTSIPLPLPFNAYYPHTKLISSIDLIEDPNSFATIYRDEAFFKKQMPEKAKFFDRNFYPFHQLNGTELHEWIIYLEHQLNIAAGFDGIHYDKFTRLLFIAWKGNPPHSYDYLSAVDVAVKTGELLAKAILSIHKQIPSLSLNIIAHSLGNGVLIKALNRLGKEGKKLVDHAFLWQAAIPRYALSSFEGHPNPPVDDPWYCPDAHKAANKFVVLYSKNDNILGPILNKKEEPPGVTLKDVWHRKDWKELLAGLFLKGFNAESIYLVANWLGFPISELLSSTGIEKAWRIWTHHHPVFMGNNRLLKVKMNLTEQYYFLVQQGLIGNLLHDEFSYRIGNIAMEIQLVLFDRYEHHKIFAFICDLLVGLLFGGTSFAYLLLLQVCDSNEFVIDILKAPGLLFHKDLSKLIHLVRQIIAFAHTVLFRQNVAVGPALGYEGVIKKDECMERLIMENRLNNYETTKWIWSHSDMKIASKDIIENVYEKMIAKQKYYEFGNYPKIK